MQRMIAADALYQGLKENLVGGFDKLEKVTQKIDNQKAGPGRALVQNFRDVRFRRFLLHLHFQLLFPRLRCQPPYAVTHFQ